MSENERFSFRWGIPLLDAGDTRIPNFFFDHYTDAGVERREFLLILHLARYQFERCNSESRPSVKTVAEQMGYSTRTVRRILSRLEGKGMLERRHRPGKTTVYDFTGFSRLVLSLELSTPLTPTSPLTPDTHVTPPLTPTSPEEEQQEEHNNNGVGHATTKQSVSLLRDLGVTKSVAEWLAGRSDVEHVRGWIAYAENAQGLTSPVAFVVSKLKAGEEPPDTEQNDADDRREYLRWLPDNQERS